ncbi:WXG100 family type VII secretion target [Janibacter anophelis]|uniref:WXG100 family type VII secretion target n=1 Tax=Janibacter anophelis TaxID=319054 RepID=UPI003F7DA69E
MAWLGMNLDVVNGELPKWTNLSEELNGVITAVNTQVQQANEAWNGNDSEKFVSEWEGTHRPQLEKIKAMIDQLSDQLQSDIAQQRETSGS